MAFNELNSVEHYIIHQLSGVNLNAAGVQEGKVAYGASWVYKSANEIQRGVNEVLVESELKDALIRLNPEINQNPTLADEVIYKHCGRYFWPSIRWVWSKPMRSFSNGSAEKKPCPLVRTTAMYQCAW